MSSHNPQFPVPSHRFLFQEPYQKTWMHRPCHPGGDHGKYGNATNSQAYLLRIAERKRHPGAAPHGNCQGCVRRSASP